MKKTILFTLTCIMSLAHVNVQAKAVEESFSLPSECVKAKEMFFATAKAKKSPQEAQKFWLELEQNWQEQKESQKQMATKCKVFQEMLQDAMKQEKK